MLERLAGVLTTAAKWQFIVFQHSLQRVIKLSAIRILNIDDSSFAGDSVAEDVNIV